MTQTIFFGDDHNFRKIDHGGRFSKFGGEGPRPGGEASRPQGHPHSLGADPFPPPPPGWGRRHPHLRPGAPGGHSQGWVAKLRCIRWQQQGYRSRPCMGRGVGGARAGWRGGWVGPLRGPQLQGELKLTITDTQKHNTHRQRGTQTHTTHRPPHTHTYSTHTAHAT